MTTVLVRDISEVSKLISHGIDPIDTVIIDDMRMWMFPYTEHIELFCNSPVILQGMTLAFNEGDAT